MEHIGAWDMVHQGIEWGGDDPAGQRSSGGGFAKGVKEQGRIGTSARNKDGPPTPRVAPSRQHQMCGKQLACAVPS